MITTPGALTSENPIGVFDSGIGGLTVAAALRKILPAEQLYYIGDTARVPYGGRSHQTIERYSIEISSLLLGEQAKAIVVACNTVSAIALDQLRDRIAVPIQGVIEPGATAAIEVTRTGHIGVIGTKATVRSGAYERAIKALAPDAQVTSLACPLLVPVIEEGMLDNPIAESVLHYYLDDLLSRDLDTLVLGCTHYPLLNETIARICGTSIRLVDSATHCALATKKMLQEADLLAPLNQQGHLQVALTDSTDGFLPVAQNALGLTIKNIAIRNILEPV